MDAESYSTPPPMPPPRGEGPSAPKPGFGQKLKKLLIPLGVVGVLLAKFKGLLIPVLKLFPVLLKTGGSMFLSIGVYAMTWGWKFAAGFVLLLFVHECGHLLAAKRIGLKVSAPVFIPFLGAIILLKEAPRNAWIEAQVGIGGPLLGTVGAVVCYVFYLMTSYPLLAALAYIGFLLNLFNLAPVGFLDGGRIVTALSPWFWILGIIVMGFMMVAHFNFVIALVFFTSLPRVFSLFRRRTEEEQRYFEVTPAQRWIIGALYFGLVVFLVVGMRVAHIRL